MKISNILFGLVLITSIFAFAGPGQIGSAGSTNSLKKTTLKTYNAWGATWMGAIYHDIGANMDSDAADICDPGRRVSEAFDMPRHETYRILEEKDIQCNPRVIPESERDSSGDEFYYARGSCVLISTIECTHLTENAYYLPFSKKIYNNDMSKQ